MTNDSKDLLEAIRGYVTPTPAGHRIGTIDSGYSSGRPKVLFDGETVTGGKLYPYLATYTPAAGHRVLLAPVGTGYVILGRIV